MNNVNILLVEDNSGDVALINAYLQKSLIGTNFENEFNVVNKSSLESAKKYISNNKADIVLLDLTLPDSKGLETISSFIKEHSNIPIIILTGLNDEEVALRALELEAQDYLLKDQITRNLLVHSIKYSIQRFTILKEKKELIQQLKVANDEIKTLRGIVPICANCKSVRDDEGYWSQVEVYVSKHSHAEFSHGICPDCVKKLYPGISVTIEDKKTKKGSQVTLIT